MQHPASKAGPALGKMLVRCRWQIKDKHFGAAVDKIKDQREPADFIGHRKPAEKPRMPRVRVSPLGPSPYGIMDTMIP